MTAPAHVRDGGWNLQVRIASGLVFLAGLWLIVSPWVFGHGYRIGAEPNDIIVGIIVAVLAAIRFASAPAMVWPSWATIPFGIWTIISPWVYGAAGQSPALEHDSVVLGVLIIVLSFWAALARLQAEEALHHSFG